MNIVSILNKLKETNMISTDEEGIALFSDCFNKFGISLLLLKDERKFSSIVDLLVYNNISLQKANGIYNLRIFAIEKDKLENIISSYKEIGEIEFLQAHPEIITEEKNIEVIFENMKQYQKEQIPYKINNDYDMDKLLVSRDVLDANIHNKDINNYLKTILKDKSLVDKVENKIPNVGEEDISIALELQKVENKICEEFLVPADDGWKIVINNMEVNSLQNIKNTIAQIIDLNIPLSFNDAFIFVLFYKTSLNILDIEKILQDNSLEGGNK